MTDTEAEAPDAPDAFDPALECRAWQKAPRIIGGPSHTHLCRQPTGHVDQADHPNWQKHACGCGHTW